MRPDWVDPDDREGLPDEATVIRELEENRKRWPGHSRLRWLGLLFGLFLLLPLFIHHYQKREWRGLIQAGGGEVRYVAAETTCRHQPHIRYQGKRAFPDVARGARVGVFARRDGWALIGANGEPCWLPEWALSATPPQSPSDARARHCGPGCHPMAPAGWFQAQAETACRYDMQQRFICLLERVMP